MVSHDGDRKGEGLTVFSVYFYHTEEWTERLRLTNQAMDMFAKTSFL